MALEERTRMVRIGHLAIDEVINHDVTGVTFNSFSLRDASSLAPVSRRHPAAEASMFHNFGADSVFLELFGLENPNR